ncbi:MAG TPA: SbcC/MukB-like Walker B domain-containing protein [Actinomycetaceae bacterium]|nr:SbcC/MukB-like Walker B domain-containing protein [Actinomycetaceae bacterium]
MSARTSTAAMTAAMGTTAIQPGQWRLERIELVNWGTFSDHHVIDVARKGYLLTGHSGSGKSSVVDAISAVLTPRGKLRFNAAAGDGTSGRDRSHVTYIRGAWRRHPDEETGEVTSDFLRTGATWSGIQLSYGDGSGDPPISLVKLFHLRRGASLPAEVSEVSAIFREPVGLLDLEDYARNGLEVRRLKKEWPNAQVFPKHSGFATRFCRLLGIAGQNALLLLHRTQSAKNLGSLDELFRTYMLDEPKTSRLVEAAVEQFGDLSEAHRQVVEAREQIAHLAQLVPLAGARAQHAQAADLAAELQDALGPFTTDWKRSLARQAHDQAEVALRDAEQRRAAAEEQVRGAGAALDQARISVMEKGGSAMQLQEAAVSAQMDRVAARKGTRARVALDLDEVAIEMPRSAAELAELLATGRREAEARERALAVERDSLDALRGELHEAKRRKDHVREQAEALRGNRSNMDRRLLLARQAVSERSGVPVSALPFAGELLQVRSEYAEWSGAIERVLRPLSRVLLVSDSHREAVVRAVDSLHLGTRLVMEIVPRQVSSPRRPGSAASVVNRVDVAAGPMAEWLHWKLAESYDYACVNNPDALRDLERGVTLAGQVKRGRRRYEKDDRWAVDDREHWVLGFDNTAKMELLLGEIRAVRDREETLQKQIRTIEDRRGHAERRLGALARLAEYEWGDIDVAAAEKALAQARARLDELLAADGGLRAAQHAVEKAGEELVRAQGRVRDTDNDCAAANAAVERYAAVLADLGEAREAVSEAHRKALEERFARSRRYRVVTVESIGDAAVEVARGLAHELQRAQSDLAKAEHQIGEIAREFQSRWPAVAADLTPAGDDVEGFLEVHARLVADRLPEFEGRFFDLLESQSRRNVGQLANEIRRAPNEIRERIGPVNDSLLRSVFDEGRHLRIKPVDCRPAVAKQFLADLNTIASDTYSGLDHATAESRFQLMRELMARLTSSETADRAWQRLCLDTRLHMSFIAEEIDGAGAVANVHDSGSGLSGGQKQKLVIFCLAAALRYQLTDDGDDVPTFGSIVLDEAFDKADATFTRMAMDIFREFGFHMILATPLKLLQVLEEYVGGVGLARCRDLQVSTVAAVSIEELAASAEPEVGAPRPDESAERAQFEEQLEGVLFP